MNECVANNNLKTYQIKPILQRVQIVDHQSRGPSTAGQGRKHVCVGGRCGNRSFLGDTFHGPNGIIGQNDGEGFNKGLEKANNDLKLTERHIVVVEGCQEEHVFARQEIVGQETTNFNIVRTIWELSPFGWMVCESIGMFLIVAGFDLIRAWGDMARHD